MIQLFVAMYLVGNAIVSRLAQITGAFPVWLNVFGCAATIAVAFSFLFLPALALYAWVLAVSVHQMARPARAVEMA